MFRISGTGCSLVDHIYASIDYSSERMRPYWSRTPGDGGLEPGKLVFTGDFEQFAGMDCLRAIADMTQGKTADAINIGGPPVVAMINAAQILDPTRFSFRFVGTLGDDEMAGELLRILQGTPISSDYFLGKPALTPFTYVLSDPEHDRGRGERTFLNNIGSAGLLTPDDLDADFFEAEMVVFGGTALVPQIHDALDVLLAKAKARGAFTVVSTIYDFRNQRFRPDARWPLGGSDEAYGKTDLLISDREEALRLSGAGSIDDALEFFIRQGVGAAVVTNGARDIALAIGWDRFLPSGRKRFPVCQAIDLELKEHPERKGDTTGCGDNFVGGMLVSLASQLEGGSRIIDLEEAITWGAACGGFACFQMGGVFMESRRGEKKTLLEPYIEAYRRGENT